MCNEFLNSNTDNNYTLTCYTFPFKVEVDENGNLTQIDSLSKIVSNANDFSGKVLQYSDRLGYGVICGADCETYFIHHKDIVSASMDERRHRKHLLEGEKVTFDWCWKVGTDNTKRQAINLRVVEGED